MNKTVHLTVLVSDETAVVEAQAPSFTENGEGSVKGAGWAKKHPNDKPDAEIGYNVAMARALRDLADKYDSRATEAMNNPVVMHTFPSMYIDTSSLKSPGWTSLAGTLSDVKFSYGV